MSSTQWANIGDDAGAPHALLERVAQHVAVPLIDRLWIFPGRKIAAGESIVIVIAAFADEPQRRRVLTARFTIARDRRGTASVTARFDEHASAPTDALPRVLDGVLRRLGEVTDAPPREAHPGGDPDRWTALLAELGAPARE